MRVYADEFLHRQGEGLPGDEQAYAGNDYANVTKQWDDDSDSDNGRPNNLTIWVLSSIWNGKNDQPLPGWPVPQNNSMCLDPGTKAKNPVGVSCAVLTKDNAKKAVTTTEASSDGAKETAGSSGSDTTNVASNEWAYAFTNLPKYYKGKEIHYSVTEEAVNGYKPVSLTGRQDRAATAESIGNRR